MKRRNGFVTNSSSTTYVCEISGESETLWDGYRRGCGFVMCENEHTFLEEFVDGEVTPELARAWIDRASYSKPDTTAMSDDEALEYCDEHCDELYSDIPQELCPLCQFKAFSQPDLAKYLEKEYGISRDDVFAEVKKVNKRRKKLYDSEYNRYVMSKYELTEDALLAYLRSRFVVYSAFRKFAYNRNR